MKLERDKVQNNLGQFLNIIIVVCTGTVTNVAMNGEFHETVDDDDCILLIMLFSALEQTDCDHM